MAAVNPCLVFGYGNPSRGDDALGPLLVEALGRLQRDGGLPGVELLTDFQLQVEHTLDLGGRERVIFVDAAETGPEPFSFLPLAPAQETGYTTHAMSPTGVLALFAQVVGGSPPPAWLLAIRGYQFELGATLTERAVANLAAASRFLREELAAAGY